MKVLDYLVTLRKRDIQVWADGDHLRCNAPTGALTIELRQELRQRKDEILKFLRSAGALAQQQRAIVPLQPRGTGTPIFAVAGHNGDVFCFRNLAQHLGADQPFYGLQPPGLDGNREPLRCVGALAAHFAAEIRAFRPDGPYVIAGYCAGGTIAFELARQLLRTGAEISDLALFGSPFPTYYRFFPQLSQRLVRAGRSLARHTRALMSLSAAERHAYIADRVCNLQAERVASRQAATDPVLVWRDKVGLATLSAIRRYTPGRFAGRLSLFWPSKQFGGDALTKWPAVTRDFGKYFGPDGCDGANMLREPYAAAFAELFKSSVRGTRNQQPSFQRQSAPIPPLWEAGHMEALSL